MAFFDELEIRTKEKRASDLAAALPLQLIHARDHTKTYRE